LRAAAAHVAGVHIVDLDGWICPGGKCREDLDGVAIRQDGVHYVGAAADRVSRWIMSRALAAVHTGAAEPLPSREAMVRERS
jgi:hypothetical protein